MVDILNLPDWQVLEVETNEFDYLITAEYTKNLVCCPYCSCFLLGGHGTKTKQIMDTPIHGKRVGILAVRRRYMCNNCHKTFLQDLPDIDEDHAMTTRLMKYLQRESFNHTFAALSREIGVDEKTIRNVFNEYVKEKEKGRVIIAPEWLGVDEIKVAGDYRGVFANVKEKAVLDLIAKRTKPKVQKWLSSLPEKDRVKLVCMDMWEPYKDLVHLTLPKATVVVDKFHWLKMANTGLDTVRKAVRAGLTERQRRALMHDRFILLRNKEDLKEKDLLLLDTWLSNFDDLRAAYELKEEMRAIWILKDRVEAEKRYKSWEKSIPESVFYAFEPMVTAMRNWSDSLYAYFDHRATNAYTESLNGLTKITNRMGRGYSFAVIRARMLYGDGSRPEKYSFLKKTILGDQAGIFTFPPPDPRTYYYFGVKISTLIKEIESGQFLPESTHESG